MPYLPTLPDDIKRFALGLGHPVALVGCRCGDCSLECCEYDLLVFSSGKIPSRITRVGRYLIEEHHADLSSVRTLLADTPNTLVIKDSASMQLAVQVNASEHVQNAARILISRGRRSLVRSLFCHGHALEADKKSEPQAAAMWLKIAAYEYLRGILEVEGARPMPLHELGQLRDRSSSAADHAGLDLAMEIIGLERASRSVLARSLSAAGGLLNDRFDVELVLAKADTLLSKNMIADCYYYAGRQVCSYLIQSAGRSGAVPSDGNKVNMKIIETALDLSADPSIFKKRQSGLFRAATRALKGG